MDSNQAPGQKRPQNNCDGCIAGYPIVDGRHVIEGENNPWKQSHMMCTASRYPAGDESQAGGGRDF